jgi:hypothetical protein
VAQDLHRFVVLGAVAQAHLSNRRAADRRRRR